MPLHILDDMQSLAVAQRRDAGLMEARRLAAVPRWQRGEAMATIARDLGVSRQAVHRWAQQYRQRGPVGLRRRPRPGRPPKLAPTQWRQLPGWLGRGAEAYGFPSAVWITQRVAQLLAQRLGVRYDRDHVCRLLHRLGWSWQKPTGRAREGHERTVHRWVKQTWPRLKKKPKS